MLRWRAWRIAYVSNVNGIRNPDFLFTTYVSDPRFERFVAIMTLLTRAQCLFWMKDPVHDGRLSIVIDHYAPAYTAEVRELLELLGLPARKASSAQVNLPVFLSLDAHESGGMGVITRSVFDLGAYPSLWSRPGNSLGAKASPPTVKPS